MRNATGPRALREWRHEQGITQQELCARARVNCGWSLEQSMVSNWEAGEQLPSRPSRVLLHQLTVGRVTPESWDEETS